MNDFSNYCNKRSPLEQMLFVIIAILAIALITVTSVYITQYLKWKKTCTDSICLKSAVRILDRVDFDADPCDDFYQFTCGKYFNSTLMPENEDQVSSRNSVNNLVDLQVKNLLEQPIKEDEPESHKFVKKLYESCMNSDSDENNTISKLHIILNQTYGWPVLERSTWNEKDFDWMSETRKFMDIGLDSDMFISIDANTDFYNTSRIILCVDQPPDFQFDSMIKKKQDGTILAVHKYFTEIAVSLGADEHTAEKDMQDVVELFMKIAKISLSPARHSNDIVEAKYLTVNQIQAEFPYLDWADYINATLRLNRQLEEDEDIMILSFGYLKKLGKLISETPKPVLANYMYTRAIMGVLTYLSDNRDYLRFERGGGLPRWKQCSKLAPSVVSPVVGAMYIQKYFDTDSKSLVFDIFENIRNQITQTIRECDWMDKDTKNHALEKMRKMKSYIGYPEELLDYERFDSVVDKLNMNTDNFLESMLILNKFEREIRLSDSNNESDHRMWQTHSEVTELNALYRPFENAMDFRAGILQDIFFEKGRPNYLNYGAIGYVIGHEMTHVFDHYGKQFDENGNLKMWWHPNTESDYEDKAKCIIDQYSSIEVPGTNITLNGLNSHGENLADNGGIRQAYRAYTKLLDTYGSDPPLPSLPYTDEQMFWISYGTTYCALQTPRKFRLDVTYNVHPPYRYRVNVPLMNTKEFSKDFHCPTGSKMNPRLKCEGLW